MFRFENLEIWKRSIELTDRLFDLADALEAKHQYRFADQLISSIANLRKSAR